MLLTLLFSMPLFDEAGSGGGSGDGGTSTGEGDGQPGPDGGVTGGGGDKGDGQPGERSFTQADLDRVAGQTRQQALDRWAREQGYDNPAEIVSIIEAKKQADEQAKSELEKAQTKADEANARADANEQLVYKVLLRSAFDRAAGDQVDDLDLAFLAANDLKLLTSEAGITVDLESLKVEGLDKAVKTLLEKKPILKRSTGAKPPGTGGDEGGTPPPPSQLTEEQKAEFQRRFGVH